MKKYFLIFFIFYNTSLIGQVQLLPSINMGYEPNDNDSICLITPRSQGNSWIPVNTGDTMADFKLWNINGDSIILSEILNTGKNVLIVSGSYTCPIFRNHMSDLNAVSTQFGSQIECLVVYTLEAHPTGSPMPYSGNINPSNPPYYQPNTYGQRKMIVQDLLNGINGTPAGNHIPVPVSVPIYIDGPCNEWWEYYNGPNNAYLIDTNGVLFAYHNWFNNLNPPNGIPTNIWCDIDSLLGVNSGGCNPTTSLSGTFDFQLKPTATMPAYGNPGDIIDIFGDIINNSNDGVKVEIERIINNLPSITWQSSMCISICLPPDQDTTSAVIPAGDTLDFSFHFFTDPMMLNSDTGRARIRFTNINGSQQAITQNYRAITYAQNSTNINENIIIENKISNIYNLSGKKEIKKRNHIQIIIFEDGRIEKRLIIE